MIGLSAEGLIRQMIEALFEVCIQRKNSVVLRPLARCIRRMDMLCTSVDGHCARDSDGVGHHDLQQRRRFAQHRCMGTAVQDSLQKVVVAGGCISCAAIQSPPIPHALRLLAILGPCPGWSNAKLYDRGRIWCAWHGTADRNA